MNLKEMRKKEFSKRFLELLNKYHFDCKLFEKGEKIRI